MALISTTERIPKDGIPLTRAEAVDYQWSQIFEWPRKRDVWAFQWGLAGLGTIASGASAQINRMYRIKLKLRNYGFVTTSFPMVLAPAMIATALHAQIVTNDLFLNETKCPLCLQYRAGVIQVAASTLYPMIMSPITNFAFAARHATYNVPYYTEVGESLKLWWKFTKPMGYTLFANVAIQGLAAMVVTHYEAECLYNLKITILRMQQEDKMINSELIAP